MTDCHVVRLFGVATSPLVVEDGEISLLEAGWVISEVSISRQGLHKSDRDYRPIVRHR